MILKSPVLIYVTNYICGKTKLLSLRKSVDEINEVIIHDLLPLLSFFFAVLCTTPNKYVVADAAGTVKPQCCVDM